MAGFISISQGRVCLITALSGISEITEDNTPETQRKHSSVLMQAS